MATKKAAAKKAAPGRKIGVSIDLGSVTATKEQIARLKAHITNHVLTWAKVDAGASGVPISTWELPPPPESSGKK
jgi:hypothetical protein